MNLGTVSVLKGTVGQFFYDLGMASKVKEDSTKKFKHWAKQELFLFVWCIKQNNLF